MQRDRLQANLLYLLFVCAVIYAAGSIRLDKATPTGVYKSAVIQSVVPKHSKYSLKVTVILKMEDGVEIVRVLDASSNYQVGQIVRLREYQSAKRTVTKYRLIP